MKTRIKLIAIALIVSFSCAQYDAAAQIKLEDLQNIDLNNILGNLKLLKVKKGFSPVFSIGNYQINTVGILGEKLKGVGILGDILEKKNVDKIMGMYKTYKTGLVVFKILSAAGTAVAVVGTVKGFTDEQNFDDATVKKMLYPALAGVATGIITKLLTKAASYKAVDVFNGVARKTIKDILSVRPASETLGVGLYVQL